MILTNIRFLLALMTPNGLLIARVALILLRLKGFVPLNLITMVAVIIHAHVGVEALIYNY